MNSRSFTKAGLRVLLAGLLSLQTPLAFAKFGPEEIPDIPDLAGIAANPSNLEDTALAPSAGALIEQKVANSRAVPASIRKLMNRKLFSYFRKSAAAVDSLNENEIDKVVRDASVVNDYFEQDNPQQEFKNVPERHVRPFLRALTFAKLRAKVRNNRVSESIGNWTIESLVVRMQLKSLAGKTSRVTHALSLITANHLKGASKAGLYLAIAGSLYYVLADFGARWSVLFVVATVVGAFRAGPLATLMNAGTSWFVNPTAEVIKRRANRVTASWELWLNYFYDRWEPRASNEDSNENTVPKVANIQEDSMDFAGMSEEEQNANWDKLLRLWVGVCKHYFKLLRDTQSMGRDLFTRSLTEEQNASLFMESLDSKLAILTVEEMQLLSPYQTMFMVRGEMQSKERLDQVFDQYRELCDKVSLGIVDEAQSEEVGSRIRALETEMRAMGLSDPVLSKIWNVQVRRAHTLNALVTGLATNEIKLLSAAEGNRNFTEEARAAQRAAHYGFNVQRFVETYGEQIRATHRKMGFDNAAGKNSHPLCQSLLEHAVAR